MIELRQQLMSDTNIVAVAEFALQPLETPREAIDAGADYLVIGRPITAAADPRAAVDKIVAELDG